MIYTISLCLFFSTYIQASPIALPQAGTAFIAPSAPPPPACSGSFPGVFGIAVVNISITTSLNTLIRRQTGTSSSPQPVLTLAQVSQIGDGQVQGGMHTVTMAPVAQATDGETQTRVTTTMPTVSRSMNTPAGAFPFIAAASSTDTHNPEEDVDHGCATPTRLSPVLGNITGHTQTASVTSTTLTDTPRIPLDSDGPITISIPTPTTSSTSTISFISISTTPVAPPSPSFSLVSCLTNSTLRLTLTNNSLHDALNRTGYIASNYQFQFDGPPQSGAIYTSGWSVCPVAGEDGTTGSESGLMTLALGGSTTFWQCLSGEFYNLYTENWAAQCSAVQIRVVGLVLC